MNTYICIANGLGANQRYVGYFSKSLHPEEVNSAGYHDSQACFGILKTHVVLSYQWQVFCKQPVKYVTL